MTKKLTPNTALEDPTLEACYQKIAQILRQSRTIIAKHIDNTRVEAYWRIGREIVEVEQQGAERADYGTYLLPRLSKKLTQEFGRGFSTSLLKRLRQFYLAYPKGAAVRHQLEEQRQSQEIQKGAALRHLLAPDDSAWPLGWTHYRLLLTLEEISRRRFYEIEAIKNQWASRELERQMNSFLFERLAKSKDKEGLWALVKEGQIIAKPEDTLKDPMVFEFLGWPERHLRKETNLETALIDNLKEFLLELGKGFAFVARQKRLSFDGQHLSVDLVFYHTILKNYILIDLKMDELTHADLGQMQVYVNYYDRECRHEGDQPTIGLILCPRSNKKLAQYFLGDQDQKIFTRNYQLYLPTEEELSEEMKRELYEIEQRFKALHDEENEQ